MEDCLCKNKIKKDGKKFNVGFVVGWLSVVGCELSVEVKMYK
jgi:hypothetical protein